MTISSDYYALLGVESNADIDTIKQAYRRKIRNYHPDKFAASLTRLKASGQSSEIRKLERKIAHAKQMTQRLNEAYAVLSDAQARQVYDEQRSVKRQAKYDADQRAQRMQRYGGDAPAQTYQPQQPKHPSAARNEGSVPWVILVGFLLVMIVVFGMFSSAITRNHTPFTTYVPNNPTAEGSVRMADLQATTNSEVATARARETLVLLPTSTPRLSSESEALGDRLMSLSSYDSAVTAYTDAIAEDSQNAVLYVKRADAHVARYENGNDNALEPALADYAQALTLNDALAQAYLGRGMLYYSLWQETDAHADDARMDLESYLALAPDADNTSIEALLDELP